MRSTLKYHENPQDLILIADSTITFLSPSKVVSLNAIEHVGYTFRGDDLKVVNGVLADGTIESLVIRDDAGKPLVEMRDLNLDIGELGVAAMEDLVGIVWIYTAFNDVRLIGSKGDNVLSSSIGHDEIHGLGGNDILDPMGGRDRMFGGKGSDIFVFGLDYGKDRIMDFDAHGGPGKQDLIGCDPTTIIDKHRDGKNTVLDFGDGDTLTLVNIRPSEISSADFSL